MVNIYNQGDHNYKSLSTEYVVSTPIIRTWMIRYNNPNSFGLGDNRSEDEKN